MKRKGIIKIFGIVLAIMFVSMTVAPAVSAWGFPHHLFKYEYFITYDPNPNDNYKTDMYKIYTILEPDICIGYHYVIVEIDDSMKA